ncbi:MAG: Na-translocating system protein MpsB [Nocardioides sp.]|nr:Na-translocating system protein MpsB [Nocardioides sp.]
MAISSGLLWLAVITAGLSDLALDGTDSQAARASGPATVVAALMVFAGAIRSALAPFHRWLPETAEAPSPVSALLHAGIVNATGVIAVLQWDLLSAQPMILLTLTVIGLVTVAWCSLEQRVRPDVKGRLAASTSAQMGWMALQVGLGAPAAALLHLMGHGAWKAWLFLRAGGAVVRARRESSRHRVALSHAWATCLMALAPALVLITLAVTVWWDAEAWSPVHLLLLGISLLVGVAIGVEAAALERSSAGVRFVVAVSGGLALAGYLFAAVVWEQEIAAQADLSHSVHPWGVPMAVAGVLAVAVLAWGAVRLQPGSHHPVATLMSSTSLPPGSRVTAPARRRSAPQGLRGPAAVPADMTRDIAGDTAAVRQTIEMAGKLMGPAWPLRATVAVNPLSGMEVLPFDTALALGERFHGTALRPSLAWFLDLYDEAQIADEALAQAMNDHGVGGGPRGTEGLLDLTREVVALDESADPPPEIPAGAARDANGSRSIAHAHLWSARAWHRTEDRTADLHGPWQLWKRSAEHPIYRLVTGSPDVDTFARSLPEDPAEAILDLLDRTGHTPTDLFDVVTGVLAAGPGWVAHAQWRARRSASVSPLVELVALRLALTEMHGDHVHSRPITRPSADSAATESPLSFLVLQKVWLDALDTSTRDLLCRPLAARQSRGLPLAPSAPRTSSAWDDLGVPVVSQSVWCIDVRSERVRRHLESTGKHETFGFAGFFGISARAIRPDGTSFDQCPVIVTPTVEIEVPQPRLEPVPAMTLVATRVAARPGLGFAVAEASGTAAFAAALTASLAPQTWRRILDRSVRGNVKLAPLALRDLADPSRQLTIEEQADAAEAMLRTIGLIDGFAPVLVLAGHGSTTENNAYATAYDCGACGGNPGLLNASAMAQVLNDPGVRHELDRRGIRVPESTRVVAALHDTTTDQVTIQQTSPADAEAAKRLKAPLDEASRLTQAERCPALPTPRRRSMSLRRTANQSLAARATDWSEPMPEWGLAGCAAIIVGPRHLTRGIDLAGRTFLHSYDRHHDPDGSVLAAILNAPVIVSQWIASQYWFSSVAPSALGAGDKTTHNVLGDIGVLSGAHGDLRTGLPWQALFARDPGTRPAGSRDPQHVPSRHLVIIDADPALLARAIRQSPTVQTLLTHDWMRMVALDHGHVIDVMSLLTDETAYPLAPPWQVDHPEARRSHDR